MKVPTKELIMASPLVRFRILGIILILLYLGYSLLHLPWFLFFIILFVLFTLFLEIEYRFEKSESIARGIFLAKHIKLIIAFVDVCKRHGEDFEMMLKKIDDEPLIPPQIEVEDDET